MWITIARRKTITGVFLKAVIYGCFRPRSATGARSSLTAFNPSAAVHNDIRENAQATTWFDPAPAMPQHTSWDTPLAEVEMKPDLDAKGFSATNALFFAGMSRIAYASEHDARGLVLGNSTCEGLGFDHFHWFEGGREARKCPFKAVHDTEAFVAANDDIIAVVFRGTKEISDWYTNVMIYPKKCPREWGVPPPGGEQHKGFDAGLSSIWDSGGMYEVIKALYNEEGKTRKLFLAGHSLGGALATNAAARLVFIDDINISGMYTMGSPRLFDWSTARHFDTKMNHGSPLKEKYFRCKNNQDIVTTVPAGPYIHVGTEILLDQYGTISIASMADRLFDQILWCLRFEFIKGIDDHATSEYVRLFKQVVINSRVPVMEKASSVVTDAMDRVAEQVMSAAMDKTNPSLEKKRQRVERIEAVKGIAREAATAPHF